MAKGSGMIHPNLATMLAVVTTDYPLEPGEAIDFLRPAVETSFNAISVDGECSTNDTVRPARERRLGGATRDDDAFARRAATRSARDLARRSSPTARARPSSPRSPSRGAATTPRRRRSRAGSPPRRSSRPRCSAATRTGAACSPRRARRRTTAATRTSIPSRVTLAFNGVARPRRAARRSGVEPDARTAPSCTIELDLGLGAGGATLPHDRPLLRLRPHQRGVPP